MIRFRLGTSVFQFRRSAVLLGSVRVFFIVGIAYFILKNLYEKLPSKRVSNSRTVVEKDELSVLQLRLAKLEEEIQRNKAMLGQVKNTFQDWMKVEPAARSRKNPNFISSLKSNRTYVSSSSTDCSLCLSNPAEVDENVLDIYEKLEFDNQDGGVWKQGWNIEYDESRWSADRKLKVFVVPHSHNDPGWIKTFEKYFNDQTQHILNNMVRKLKDDKRRKFIWAEVSFFAFWWERIPENAKLLVKKFLADGQLEIVTGGWVMNDEATSHYYAMIEQMVEGHQWLEHNLDYRPRNGWAIDPFGLSPSMAYLLRRMGLDNMVVQRVHYSIKKYLAQHKSLEFLWRQPWDHNHTMDILCHTMPFYSYDIPHTCGPDPKICCQFDFKRLPGNKVNCPWRVPPSVITGRNVGDKSLMLLDQYRKKSELFRTNVLMVQLGDDFRYDKITEWDQQFTNYQKLFDYINSNEDWHAEVQFGTLEDYFNALRKETGTDSRNMPLNFPSLSGDFFTYADRDDHYWSGFFTSRPFYKNMDRSLEAYLRGGEILFSLMWAEIEKSGAAPPSFVEVLMTDLVYSRRALSLFQHHDAITGTSKDHVVIDYSNRMFNALNKLQNIISQTASYLMVPDLDKASFAQLKLLQLDEYRQQHNSIPIKTPINISAVSNQRHVILYNSLSHTRKEIVSFRTSSSSVEVTDSSGKLVPCQINPAFHKNELVKNEYELLFLSEVPALGLATYSIKHIADNDAALYRSSLTFFNIVSAPEIENFAVQLVKPSHEFTIKSSYVTATFSGYDGLLKQAVLNDHELAVDIKIQFLKYGTRTKGKDKSGAYIFLPDKDAQEIKTENPEIRVVEGPLMSEVVVFLPEIEHHLRIKSSPGLDGCGLDVYNVIDMGKEMNKELVMRIITNISNENQDFFTDLNGLQMVKRHTFDKLPIQANVYPMTTMSYFEDKETRLSILTGHSLGVASLQPGWLEVFLDRRLNQDDNRGLQQGVTDNKRTPMSLRILIERVIKSFTDMTTSSYPSLLAHHVSLSLLHPLFTLVYMDPQVEVQTNQLPLPFQTNYSPVGTELPCDVHLLNLRTLVLSSSSGSAISIPSNSSSLFLHRIGFDCKFRTWAVTCSLKNGTVSIDGLFPKLFGPVIEEASLSLMYMGNKFSRDANIQLPSMEIVTLRLSTR